MGNNNATPSLTEEDSSKLAQDQEYLADGDKEKGSFPDGGKIDKGVEHQSKESVKDAEEEEMHPKGLEFESPVMETDEQLQKQTSVAQGVETVAEVEERWFSMIGTQTGNEEKPSCVIDEIVFVSPSLYETVESEEEIVHAEEVAKLDQETGLEQRTGFGEIEPQGILNLDYRVVDDDDVQVISKLGSEESNATSLEVYKEERDMEIGRESSLKRMSRCRSLPVSYTNRVMGNSLVPQVASPSRNKSETLLVACVGSKKTQETSDGITECNEEAELPSSGIDELTEKLPLLCQDKSETHEATINVEEKTVMLKRSECEKTRSLEMWKKESERAEANDSLEERKASGDDNLLDKKALSGSMKGRVRKRSKSSLLGTCLCCAAAMN